MKDEFEVSVEQNNPGLLVRITDNVRVGYKIESYWYHTVFSAVMHYLDWIR